MFCFYVSNWLILVQLVISWDLSSYDVEKNLYVSSIAVYRTRAFLALPRSVCHNNETGPTLVETLWTGDIFHSSSNLLSGRRQKVQVHQNWNDCEHIQDAISLDIEIKRHRLWILDRGNTLCHPKIISFNLLYNIISDVSELANISGEHLNVITIDPEIGKHGYRAYIARTGNNEILVLSLNKLIWWKLKLSEPSNPLKTIKADFLAISKTSPQLFLTSKDDDELFALDIKNIRNSENQVALETTVVPYNVTSVGRKLGLSSGLETDLKSGLIYFMTRDYAIVRWVIGSPLEAEFHNVLMQSYDKLPYVSQLFTDPQKSIWALVNKDNPEECSTRSTSNESESALGSRVVRILRYSKFRNEIEREE
ncbi:unnamed protein product [Phaedon cochleariae]|uniref:Bee-milk protein n=1 Tax=Phaedon cochleariae TaxID=80249 RepID=A0A9P0DBY7_PHACE|nr:unnamed protein product [Phaedon cochleariae]